MATVRDYMKKWAPVTDGLREDAKGLCAWAMELEARSLSGCLGPNSDPGPALKYVFPTIRRVVDQWRNRSPLVRLAECVERDPESDEDTIRGIFECAWLDIVAGAAAAGLVSKGECVPLKFRDTMIERLIESIRTYPGIDG